MVAQIVRHQQCGQRLRKAGDMLGDVDQRDREIARGVQHRKRQRADQDHVAGGRRAVLPQPDRPGQQAERQNDRHDGVKNAELLKIEQAPPARLHLVFDRRVKAATLAKKSAEGADQWHVAHDVGHFAVNGRGLAGEIVVQRPARGREAKHDEDHDAATTARLAAMGRLTVKTRAIAANVATHGGNTFQTNMFSPVNTAFDVAVTRLVSVPGKRSAK